MKKKVIVIFLLCASCVTPRACPDITFNQINKITRNDNGELYTGRCTTYENDKKRSVQQYLNGKDYGKWVFYFPNGSVQTKGSFNKEGKRIGTWKYYHENGELSQVSRYSKNGERAGKWTQYDINGEKIGEINY